MQERARPWLIRTYGGHSTPAASNALYRENLRRGQTGLSVAFDLPTQTGYDPDHPLAAGEVGKVGVPVAHLGDMRALFDGIPLGTMNTSMTINATAPWLLALYVALAEERGDARAKLAGTTQNDILKEYLSRGTFIFPPAASMRLTADVVTFCAREMPAWNPMNVCSYHLQEAGATPVQELAYALCTAIAVLDEVKRRPGGPGGSAGIPAADDAAMLGVTVGRISFFVNAGIRFIEEMCKMRAFARLWDRLTRERYGVTEAKQRVLRYGLQVNSLGLTAREPENNIVRIVLEMLGAVLSKSARARAVQLPAWNEALGLPRAVDQKWSLRAQQIVAYETDLLEYEDLFDGSKVVEAKVRELEGGAWAEIERVLSLGGPIWAVESGYVKERLVESSAARLARIEKGDTVVVGVNRFTDGDGAASPLAASGDAGILKVDPEVEAQARAGVAAWRSKRDEGKARAALAALRQAAEAGTNIMPPSIEAARAGVTTGEWGGVLRQVFGEYRAPTGVAVTVRGQEGHGEEKAREDEIRDEVRGLAGLLGRPAKILVGKPGLDGHSSGAEQIALRARDSGFEVVYEGIRRTPAEIVASAVEEGVHLVGLSILSGSHLTIVPEVIQGMRDAGLGEVPVVVGGIIPPDDKKKLLAAGVARVFTPEDFALGPIMKELVLVIRAAHGGAGG